MSKMTQGSPEWLAMRKEHIGASDAPIVMGVSPWRTPYQLWQEKLGMGKPQEWNAAMKRGNDLEPKARAEFELLTGLDMYPQVVFHPEHKFMMASLDGLSLCGKHAVEIKCTSKANHILAQQGEVPDYYYPQLQHQLACLGIDMLYYFSFDGYNGAIVEVERNDSYIEALIREESVFWECLKDKTPPPLTDKDYVERDDRDWLATAERFCELERQMKSMKDQRDDLRKQLIRLANQQPSQGGGVKLSKAYVQGGIDYKAIPQLQDMDLTPYKKEDRESWRLTLK